MLVLIVSMGWDIVAAMNEPASAPTARAVFVSIVPAPWLSFFWIAGVIPSIARVKRHSRLQIFSQVSKFLKECSQ